MPVIAPPRKATSSAGRDAAAGRLGDARVRAHRDVHADVAGRRRTGCRRSRSRWRRARFWIEDQRDEQHDADDGDHRVLAVQVGPGALLDGAGDALHPLVARRQREQLRASSERRTATARPAQTSATTTPWSVRKSLKEGSFVEFWLLRGAAGSVATRGRAADGIAWRDAPAKRRGSLSARGAEERAGYCPGTQRRPDDWAGPASLGPLGAAPAASPARVRPRRSPAPAAPAACDLRVGQLELGERLADLGGVRASSGSTSGSSARDALDRLADLLGVALVLGPGLEPGLAAAEVEQRDERLDEDVLDADPLELRPRRPRAAPPRWALAARAACSLMDGGHLLQRTSRASRATVSAKTSRRWRPSAISARWRWAPLRSGSDDVDARARRGPARSTRAAARAPRRSGTPRARSRSIMRPSMPVADRPPEVLLDQAPRRGRATGTPSSSSRAACSTQATISAASASDSRGGRLGVADAHLDRAEREVRADRPPDLRVLDDRVGPHQELEVVAVAPPSEP